MAEINNAILKSADILISKKLEELEYDKTILGVIVNDGDAMNGHYVVNDGSIDFDAYSENTTYVAGDHVYVTVPKGDFTQNKLIISKYTADNEKNPITYSPVLDQVILVSEDLLKDNNNLSLNTILANGRTEPRTDLVDEQGNYMVDQHPPGAPRCIWGRDLTIANDSMIKNNSIFDTLAVKVGFTCALGQSYDVVSGTYGLIFQIKAKDTNNGNTSNLYRFVLDSTDFSGNPYYFLSSMQQNQKINISNLGNIETIEVYLYQSSDFYYYDNANNDRVLIPTPLNGEEINDDYNNIRVDNLELYFGIDTTKADDNTFAIYTSDHLNYDLSLIGPEEVAYNTKTIIPIWFNKGQNDKYIGYSDGIYDYYESDIDAEHTGKNYKEDYYREQLKVYEAGSKIMENDFNDYNIPPVLELYQAYDYGLQIKEILERIHIKLSQDANNYYTNLVSDVSSYLKDPSGAQEKLQELTRNGGQYNQILDRLTVLMDDSDSDGFMPKLIDILQYFGTWYITKRKPPELRVNTLIGGLSEIISVLKNQILCYVNSKSVTGTEVNGEAIQFFEYLGSVCPRGQGKVFELWKTAHDKLINECVEGLDNAGDIIKELKKIVLQAEDDFAHNEIITDLSYYSRYNNFMDTYSNRYCIYWYRYKEGYSSPNEYYQPQGWERITEYDNMGLPDTYFEDEDKNKYFDVRPTQPSVALRVGLRTQKEDRIQAILIFNHQIFKSNILVFTNDQPVEDEDTAAILNGLYLSLTDEEQDYRGNIIKEDTYHSKSTYQLYGVNNYLVNGAEKFKKRKIRARYKTRQLDDEILRSGCRIYWFVPTTGTMLTYNVEELIKDGFGYFVPNYTEADRLVRLAKQNINILPEEIDKVLDIARNNSQHIQDDLAEFNFSQEEIDNVLFTALKNYRDAINDSDEAEDSYELLATAAVNSALFSLKVRQAEENTYAAVGALDFIQPAEPYSKYYTEDVKNYAMFYKDITSYINDEGEDKLDVESTEFSYYIKDYYLPTATNNVIKCKVVRNDTTVYEAEQMFIFSSYGTSGTDYSLVITPSGFQSAVQDFKPLELSLGLYDHNGDLMEDKTAAIIYHLDQPDQLLVTTIGEDDELEYYFEDPLIAAGTSDILIGVKQSLFYDPEWDWVQAEEFDPFIGAKLNTPAVEPTRKGYYTLEKYDVLESDYDDYILEQEENNVTKIYMNHSSYDTLGLSSTDINKVKTILSGTLTEDDVMRNIHVNQDDVIDYLDIEVLRLNDSPLEIKVTITLDRETILKTYPLTEESIAALDVRFPDIEHTEWSGTYNTVSAANNAQNTVINRVLAILTPYIKLQKYVPIDDIQKYIANSYVEQLIEENEDEEEEDIISYVAHIVLDRDLILEELSVSEEDMAILDDKFVDQDNTEYTSEPYEEEADAEEDELQVHDLIYKTLLPYIRDKKIQETKLDYDFIREDNTFTIVNILLQLKSIIEPYIQDIKFNEGVRNYKSAGEITGFNPAKTYYYFTQLFNHRNLNYYKYGVLNAEINIDLNYSQLKYNQRNNDKGSADTDRESDTQDIVKTIKLKAFYPVPWAAGDYYIEGPTTVVYNSMGTSPVYYSNPFVLYDANTNLPVDNVEWKIGYLSERRDEPTTTLIRDYMPKLKKDYDKNLGIDKYSLQVPTMFLSDNNYVCYVIASTGSGNNERWLYVQPIVLLQNRYASPMLNSWDGELTIDEKNGIIMSAMVGAGKKEDDNTFSGVLMGEVAEKTLDSATDEGLFGFNHGEQSFAFKTDGTAFIGKAGRGRIEFNGNSGVIQSMSYGEKNALTPTGMQIDLDDGIIDIRGSYIDHTRQTFTKARAIMNDTSLSEAAKREALIAAVGEHYSHPEYWDNNEVNGVENTLLYTPSGSRVTISANSPYLEIKSPTEFYNKNAIYITKNIDGETSIGSKSLSSLRLDFWNNVDYYRDTTQIANFLKNYYNIENGKSFIYSQAVGLSTQTTRSLQTIYNDIKAHYLQNDTPLEFFVPIGLTGDQPPSKSFNDIFGSGDNYNSTLAENVYSYGDAEHNYDTLKDSQNLTEINDKIFHFNDYFLITGTISDNKIFYISKDERLGVEDYPKAPVITGNAARKVWPNFNINLIADIDTKKEIVLNEIGNPDRGNYSYETIEALSAAIANSKVKIQRGIQDNSTSTTDKSNDDFLFYAKPDEPNFHSCLALKMLRKEDYDTAMYYYISPIKESKSLVKIGLNEYYLQTDNYRGGSAANGFRAGQGVKFDLQNGNLIAYDFSLNAVSNDGTNYVCLNSEGNGSRPYFVVHYGGDVAKGIAAKDLLKISKNEFVLRSQDYKQSDDGSGTEIDLKTGHINSYNFNLKATNSDQTSLNKGSYFRMRSNGEPYLQIHYNRFNENESHQPGTQVIDTDLMYVSNSQFFIRSQNWDNDGEGVEIDLVEGKIIMNNSFDFKAVYTREGNRYKDSFIWMKLPESDSDPFLEIYCKDSNKGYDSDLLKATPNSFIIQSPNYNPDSKTGMKLDLMDGSIKAYNNFIIDAEVTNVANNNYRSGIYISNNGTDKSPYLRIMHARKSELRLFTPLNIIDQLLQPQDIEFVSAADIEFDDTYQYYELQNSTYVPVTTTEMSVDYDDYYLAKITANSPIVLVTPYESGDELPTDRTYYRNLGNNVYRTTTFASMEPGDVYSETRGTYLLKDKTYLYPNVKPLIDFTNNSQILQSANYIDNTSGTHINLADGKIKSYNLDLNAWTTSGQWLGSQLTMKASGDPFIQIHYNYSGSETYPSGDQDGLYIGKKGSTFEYVLRSPNYKQVSNSYQGRTNNDGSGLEIDVFNGKIRGDLDIQTLSLAGIPAGWKTITVPVGFKVVAQHAMVQNLQQSTYTGTVPATVTGRAVQDAVNQAMGTSSLIWVHNGTQSYPVSADYSYWDYSSVTAYFNDSWAGSGIDPGYHEVIVSTWQEYVDRTINVPIEYIQAYCFGWLGQNVNLNVQGQISYSYYDYHDEIVGYNTYVTKEASFTAITTANGVVLSGVNKGLNNYTFTTTGGGDETTYTGNTPITMINADTSSANLPLFDGTDSYTYNYDDIWTEN